MISFPSKPSNKPSESGGNLSPAYYSTLKMEAIYSSEISDSLRNKRRYNTGDNTLLCVLVYQLSFWLKPMLNEQFY
jgi:hypothetical protein